MAVLCVWLGLCVILSLVVISLVYMAYPNDA